MSAGHIGSGTEPRDNRHVNHTSDGSRDMESSETDQSVQNFGVQIKDEPNTDDTCTYGTSSRNVTGIIEQFSDYPSENSGKGNLYVHSELGSVFRDGTDYAVCIKYEPKSSEPVTDPVASVNYVDSGKSHVMTKDYLIKPEKASSKLCYHEHSDNKMSYHDNPDNNHHGGHGKNTFCNLQNQNTQTKYGTLKYKNPRNPTQKNTVSYTNNNSGNSGHNHHDHNHIFSISDEKINGSDNSDNSPEQQHTTRKVFKCDICSYIITMPSDSEANSRKDTVMKQYNCDICSYSTVYPRNLAFHNQKHTGVKLHKCNVCSYSTDESGRLLIHKRKHTGETPFKCDMCSYSTTSSGSLKTHKQRHAVEKPFK